MSQSLNLRLSALLLLTVLCLQFWGCVHEPTLARYWQVYKRRFITGEGRIVDTGKNGISHSEGQGYGMLLAGIADERQTFDLLWRWTKKNLQKRRDHLFAWQYVPGKGIGDFNNATDGDILIAWALLRAGRMWNNDEYLSESRNIVVDIRKKLVRVWHGKTVLLPGEQNFSEGENITINLSYWVFPALDAFSAIDPSPVWQKLIEDGLALEKMARFGSLRLPPDWLELGGEMRLSARFQPLFGYDAIRIPLYMVWNRNLSADEAEGYLAYADVGIQRKGFLPAYIRLTDDSFADYRAPRGTCEVFSLIRAVAAHRKYLPGELPGNSDDYYSSTLTMLVWVAAQGYSETL